MTPRERELIEETADQFGCSLNVAARLLIRRGFDWHGPPGLMSPKAQVLTKPPVDGALPEVEALGYERYDFLTPDVPAGQTTILDDDQ